MAMLPNSIPAKCSPHTCRSHGGPEKPCPPPRPLWAVVPRPSELLPHTTRMRARRAVPRMEGAEATPQSSQHTGQPVTLPGQAGSGKDIKQPGPAQVPPPRLRCWTPDHGFTSDSPGSVLKYSFDFIHFFFSKVNDSEMNPPVLLDAHLPGKQNTEVWSWVHDRRSPNGYLFCKVQKGPPGMSRQESRAQDRTLWLARPRICIPTSLTKKTTEFKHVDLINENARCKRLQAQPASGPAYWGRDPMSRTALGPSLSLPQEVYEGWKTEPIVQMRTPKSSKARLDSSSLPFPVCAAQNSLRD